MPCPFNCSLKVRSKLIIIRSGKMIKQIEEPQKKIPVIAEPDVLVVEGGPAGIGAAISAARNGAEVLLVERYGFVGGNMKIAMVNHIFTLYDEKGSQVIRVM